MKGPLGLGQGMDAALRQQGNHPKEDLGGGPRITQRAFGRDWRYPITNRFS